jgi:hypothetical protein
MSLKMWILDKGFVTFSIFVRLHSSLHSLIRSLFIDWLFYLFTFQEFWLWISNPVSPLEALSISWRWTIQVPFPQCWAFWLRSPQWVLSLSPPRSLVLSRGSPHLPLTKAVYFHSFSWPSGLPFCPLPHHIWSCSLFFPSPSLPLPPVIISFPFLSGIEDSSPGHFCLLHLLWSVGCILGILYVLANIHLSLSTYHACPFSYFTQDIF